MYFTNRALCWLKLRRWDAASADCRRALDMDGTLVKAHFFLGQSLLEQDCLDEAIKHLHRGIFNQYKLKISFKKMYIFCILAMDLAKEQKKNFGDDIALQLRTARKKRFAIQEEKRIAQEIELQSYLNKLLREETERQLSVLNTDDPNDQEKAKQIEEQCVRCVADYIKFCTFN